MKYEFEGKKLLVLGATDLIIDIVKHAQKMGIYVIVADYYQDSPAKKYADEALLMDATDVDAIVDYCKQKKVDAVTTGFLDVLLESCYEVCKRLSLPFFASKKMIEMSTNKTVFKEICQKYNVPVPKNYYVGEQWNAGRNSVAQYPVFVKPLDASGSRGAGVCYNEVELKKQFNLAKDFSPSDTVIIEEYITGREFLLDYIAVNGEYRLLESFDRYVCDDRSSAINYANLSISPSKSLSVYYTQINENVIDMFRSEGINDGLIFLQGHFDGKKITFYEMGCRLGGSFYNIEQVLMGDNTVDMIIRYAFSGKMTDLSVLAEDIACYKTYGASYNFLLNGKDEVVHKVVGVEKIRKMKSVVEIIQRVYENKNYHNDRIIDKPALTVHFVAETIEDLKSIVFYMNDVFNITDKNGQSLLMKKFNPEEIDY